MRIIEVFIAVRNAHKHDNQLFTKGIHLRKLLVFGHFLTSNKLIMCYLQMTIFVKYTKVYGNLI